MYELCPPKVNVVLDTNVDSENVYSKKGMFSVQYVFLVLVDKKR